MPPEKMRPGILALGLGTRGGHSIAVPKPAPAPKWFERYGLVRPDIQLLWMILIRMDTPSLDTVIRLGLVDISIGMSQDGWDSSIETLGEEELLSILIGCFGREEDTLVIDCLGWDGSDW